MVRITQNAMTAPLILSSPTQLGHAAFSLRNNLNEVASGILQIFNLVMMVHLAVKPHL